MAKISYYKWEIKDKTLVAYGGKVKQYRHSFPVSDLFQIVDEILTMYNKNKIFSRLDILNKMDKTKLKTGKIFNKKSHEYKIKMVFDILLSEKLIRHEGIMIYYKGRKGRNPHAFVLNKNEIEIRKWLKTIHL